MKSLDGLHGDWSCLLSVPCGDPEINCLYPGKRKLLARLQGLVDKFRFLRGVAMVQTDKNIRKEGQVFIRPSVGFYKLSEVT